MGEREREGRGGGMAVNVTETVTADVWSSCILAMVSCGMETGRGDAYLMFGWLKNGRVVHRLVRQRSLKEARIQEVVVGKDDFFQSGYSLCHVCQPAVRAPHSKPCGKLLLVTDHSTIRNF